MTSKIFIPVKPVPASRPRISKYGNYYTKNYADFRKEVFRFFKTIRKDYTAIDNVEFKVKLDIICYRPEKPSNQYPVGDVDNYAKGYLDSITYAKLFWKDDIQVTELIVTKRYQEKGEDYGATLSVEEV